jgi:hydroxymethylglutaryl-CoA reductase (NADPH)
VLAEVKLTKKTLEQTLHTTQHEILETFEAKYHVGTNLALSFSQNMQVANVAAAIYLATGQDLAHVVDASGGTLIVEPEKDGIYIALTLPSLIVGSVGGGTWLPAQTLARDMIHRRCTSKELVAAIATGCLAGELSGLSALATHTLAKAHATHARAKKSYDI